MPITAATRRSATLIRGWRLRHQALTLPGVGSTPSRPVTPFGGYCLAWGGPVGRPGAGRTARPERSPDSPACPPPGTPRRPGRAKDRPPAPDTRPGGARLSWLAARRGGPHQGCAARPPWGPDWPTHWPAAGPSQPQGLCQRQQLSGLGRGQPVRERTSPATPSPTPTRRASSAG